MNAELMLAAIRQLRPGASFIVTGTNPTLADVNWTDQVQAKPTQAELDVTIASLQVAAATVAQRAATDDSELTAAKNDNLLQTVLNMTPAQLGAEVDAAFTDPAQRVFMKRVLRILIPTARRVFRS
jgi:hypothetical protein